MNLTFCEIQWLEIQDSIWRDVTAFLTTFLICREPPGTDCNAVSVNNFRVRTFRFRVWVSPRFARYVRIIEEQESAVGGVSSSGSACLSHHFHITPNRSYLFDLGLWHRTDILSGRSDNVLAPSYEGIWDYICPECFDSQSNVTIVVLGIIDCCTRDRISGWMDPWRMRSTKEIWSWWEIFLNYPPICRRLTSFTGSCSTS